MFTVVWWEVESSDPDRLQTFFSAIFGWQFVSAFRDTDIGADYWIAEYEGRGLGGVQRAADGVRAPQVGTRIYVEVAALEETLDRVVAHGGQIERHRTELGGDDRWFATFTEPTGVSFGLWTANPPRQS